jgi:hypothetical protein
MADPLSQPIAVRELHLLPSRRPVVLELDAPVARRAGTGACAYRVTGLGRPRAGRATGADGLEALLLAVEAVRRELEPFEGRLTWTGEPGELGLPTAVPDFLGADFRRRVARMVRSETERETRRLQDCVAPASGDRPLAD